MFTIMAYEAEQPRAHKLHKLACKYLFPVQQSVFQGYLTDRQLEQLKQQIARIADPAADRVIFYKTPDEHLLQTDALGACVQQEIIF